MDRKIITSFIAPPIGVRSFDWQAYFDGDEPSDDGQMMIGHGETERDAVSSLFDADDERKDAQ